MKQAVMMALAALLWSGALQAQGSVSTDGAQQGAAAVAAAVSMWWCRCRPTDIPTGSTA